MGNSSSLNQRQRLEKELVDMADKLNELERHAMFKKRLHKSMRRHGTYVCHLNERELEQEIQYIRYQQTSMRDEYDQLKRQLRIIVRRENYQKVRKSYIKVVNVS
jgi:chaperonin cofactor prefoldin